MRDQGSIAPQPATTVDSEYSALSSELSSAIAELTRSLAALDDRLAPVKYKEMRPEAPTGMKTPRDTAPMSPLGLFLSEQLTRIHQLQLLVRTNIDELRI